MKLKYIILIVALFSVNTKVFSSEQCTGIKSTLTSIKNSIQEKARTLCKNTSSSCILVAQYIACLTYLNKIAIEKGDYQIMKELRILNLASIGIAAIYGTVMA